MQVKLVKIGNSRGVRLPKAVISSCGFQEDVDLTVQNGEVIIKPLGVNRTIWKEMFQMDLQEKPIHEKGEWQW